MGIKDKKNNTYERKFDQSKETKLQRRTKWNQDTKRKRKWNEKKLTRFKMKQKITK